MNGEELHNEWVGVCRQIISYPNINPSQFNAFVSRLKPQAMSTDYLMLTADNDFIKTWIEHHYIGYIKQALHDIYAVDFLVEIEVDVSQMPEHEHQPITTETLREINPTDTEHKSSNIPPHQNISTPTGADQVTEEPIKDQTRETQQTSSQQTAPSNKKTTPSNAALSHTSLLPSYTFSNFVIGDSNSMAYSMAVAVAEEPGQQMLNPLFIYGKSGLGKTHLLRAIQNYLTETRPELKTIYVDSADFLSGFMDATLDHDKDKASFRNFKKAYTDADVLLIDDVQYLQGKKQTLDIVFQIFNDLTNEGRQVVLSADRAPKNIDIDERYQSRFNAGGTYDIQPPEVETKMGIIRSFIEEYRVSSGLKGFDISPAIQKYIAENSSSNIRELKSAVTKVIFRVNAFEEEITPAEIRKLLENHFSGGAMKKLSVGDIQKQVEQYYKVSHADLIGKKRTRNIVYARQIAIYLCRQMLDLPYDYIAQEFGGRDHTTVMYSVNNITQRINENRETREEIETIKQMIRDM